MKIPYMLHQIWSSKKMPLPDCFLELSETWKEKHPNWQYVFWDDEKMDCFMKEYFPQYIEVYNKFPYDIQRWDSIRYLILYQFGGVYVDFDVECLENIEPLLKNNCCFGSDVQENIVYSSLIQGDDYLNNTFMATVPGHPFFAKIIKHVFEGKQIPYSDSIYKLLYVLQTTGSIMLSNLKSKDDTGVYVIPARYISPFSITESQLIRHGKFEQEWEDRLQQAYAVHYFMGTWGYLNLKRVYGEFEK